MDKIGAMADPIDSDVMHILLPEREGLSAPEILRLLRPPVSQPTLWRVLDRLRAQGRIRVSGKARATRYSIALPMDLAARRSLQMHAAVARRLARDASLLTKARERLAYLEQVNPAGRVYHTRWKDLIDGSLARLLRVMTEDSEASDALRKESPFSTLVTPAERNRIFENIR